MRLHFSFNGSSFLAMALTSLATAGPAPAATLAAGAEAMSTAFGDAMNDYEDSHWSAAYARLTRLADGGHPEAARIALLMVRHGTRLYGQDWRASPSQLEQWRTLAARRLSELDSVAGDGPFRRRAAPGAGMRRD